MANALVKIYEITDGGLNLILTDKCDESGGYDKKVKSSVDWLQILVQYSPSNKVGGGTVYFGKPAGFSCEIAQGSKVVLAPAAKKTMRLGLNEDVHSGSSYPFKTGLWSISELEVIEFPKDATVEHLKLVGPLTSAKEVIVHGGVATEEGIKQLGEIAPDLRWLSCFEQASIPDLAFDYLPGGLESLCLSEPVSSDGIYRIAKACPNILELNVTIRDQECCDAFQELGRLKKLSVLLPAGSNISIRSLSVKGLTDLKIFGDHNIALHPWLDQLDGVYPGLKSLGINHHHTSNDEFREIVRLFPNLESLGLPYSEIDDEGLRYLNLLNGLMFFDCSNNGAITRDSRDFLISLKARNPAMAIDLAGNPNVYDIWKPQDWFSSHSYDF